MIPGCRRDVFQTDQRPPWQPVQLSHPGRQWQQLHSWVPHLASLKNAVPPIKPCFYPYRSYRSALRQCRGFFSLTKYIDHFISRFILQGITSGFSRRRSLTFLPQYEKTVVYIMWASDNSARVDLPVYPFHYQIPRVCSD